MNRHSPALLVAVTLSLLGSLALASASAADASPKATGTLSGKVLDDKGAPAKGVRVAAYEAGAFAERKAKSAADTPDAGKTHPEPVARTTTGDDGTYTLTNVPVEKVRILAGAKGVGLGYSRELVQVKAGETTKVPDIKLRPVAATPKSQRPGTTP